ncbi:hypothetical protein DFP72DRAFT_887669 [Ephemerocybe angulata]|uniref:F-box domain-containing protein n=1 Tax=Ephemerocybe angulata TaxID=980116 RepID=A0A8H6I4I7_9AGAR|nr:hypothetical protein DFP72DRAFT_887669 [Tulosesus angulatus]
MAPLELTAEEKFLHDKHSRKLKTLEQVQSDLLAKLAKVSQSLATAKVHHGQLHNNNAPAIARLPKNILSTIFSISHLSESSMMDGNWRNTKSTGLGSTSQDLSRFRATRTRLEISVSQVCGTWRNIALETHALWCVFWCDKLSSCESVICEARRLQTYLQRSGCDRALEFYFDFTWDKPAPESQVSRTLFKEFSLRLLSLIVPHSERWKSLTIVANDTSMRVPLNAFRHQISCICTPRLERMVICAGPVPDASAPAPMSSESGWESQVLLLQGQDERGPCPSLHYLKLDAAGLAFCRPPIQSLAHLALEHGPRDKTHSTSQRMFTINWLALIGSDILRSPHLETLSLCEDVLLRTSFPDCHTTSDPVQGNRFLGFPALKHLRIGGSVDEGLHNRSGSKGHFLWYLLRYVTATQLETLIISNYALDRDPWPEFEWASGTTFRGRYSEDSVSIASAFPSLRKLVLCDITTPLTDVSQKTPAALLRLALMTYTVSELVFSCENQGLDTLLALFQHEGGPHIPLAALWPHASEVSLNFPTALDGMRDGLEEYMRLCDSVSSMWKHIDLLRIPPIWVDAWEVRLSNPALLAQQYIGGDNFVWGIWTENDGVKGETGINEDGEESESDLEAPSEPVRPPGAPRRSRLLRILPIEEIMPRYWPPTISFPHNTLSSEHFDPFNPSIHDGNS